MDWITSIVDHVFEVVPYSAQSLEARNQFASKLRDIAHAMAEQGEEEHQVAGVLLRQYGSIDAACSLLEISSQSLLNTEPVTAPQAKKWLRRFEWRTLIAALFICCTVYPLLHWIVVGEVYSIIPILVMTGATAFLIWRLTKQPRIIFGQNSLTFDAADYLHARQSAYRKRLLNSVLLGAFLLLEYSLLVSINIRAGALNTQELRLYIILNTNLVLAGVFLIVKNGLRLKWLEAAFNEEGRKTYKSYGLKLVLAALTLALVVLLGSLTLPIERVPSYCQWTATAYAAALALISLLSRRRYAWAKLVFNKRRIVVFATVMALYVGLTVLNSASWFVQPYISSTPYVPHRQHEILYEESSGIYTIKTDVEDFKILQLSDIHLGGSLFSVTKDHKALSAVYALISETRPDLVIVTGDLVFPMGVMSLSLNNYTPVMQFSTFMRNMGIPWVFTYGNHDTEVIASHTQEDLDSLLKSMSFQSTQSLLYPHVQPDITGRNNQVVRIENQNGELMQALFILDSNAYIDGGFSNYDYIHDDQVQWYEETLLALRERYGTDISSLLYFHIPLQEYRDAYELYQAGSQEVAYFYGIIGEKNEAICCSEHPSKLFEKAVELGSTKAMFVGHDHYNSLSIKYKGIRLTYGMSIDYLAMPGIEYHTEQRGGTLVTLLPGSEINITPVKLVDIEHH